MKSLIVGDPHIKPNNIAEGEKLIDFIIEKAKTQKVNQIIFLGDLFHTHAVKRLEVEVFWDQTFKRLRKEFLNQTTVQVLVGNHDQIGSKEKEQEINALNVFNPDHLAINRNIINKPQRFDHIAYMPYMSDHDKFIKEANKLYDQGARLLVAHQTFQGATYENGFYAPDGIETKDIKFDQILSGHIHCFSEDTEFLTDDGWKCYDNIEDYNKLVSLNLTEDKLEYCEIQDRVKRHVNEDLYHLKSTHIDQLVTSKHRVLVKKIGSNRQIGDYEIFHADMLPGDFLKIPTANILDWDGLVLSDEELRLIVWVVADGSIETKKNSNSLGIRWHLKKIRKVERLTQLLDKLKIKYSSRPQQTGNYKIRISNSDQYHNKIIDWCYIKSGKKQLPTFIKQANLHQTHIIFDEYAHTDGNYHSINNKHLIQISTSKQIEGDILQELAHTNGFSCKISPKKGNGKNIVLSVNKNKYDAEMVRCRNIKIQKYIGNVVCFTVKNSTLMVRRNGCVFISGNCQQECGKVWYPGTPKWDTTSDANEDKGIWVLDHNEDGTIKSKKFFSTAKVVTPIYKFKINEGDDLPKFNKNARNHVELIGSSAWIKQISKKIKGKASIKAKPTDRKKAKKVIESISFEEAAKSFEFINGVKYNYVVEYIGDLHE